MLEWGGQAVVALSECPIEVGKAKKPLKLLLSSGKGPVFNCCHLRGICTKLSFIDHKSQKTNGRHMEFTFVCFCVQLVFQ